MLWTMEEAGPGRCYGANEWRSGQYYGPWKGRGQADVTHHAICALVLPRNSLEGRYRPILRIKPYIKPNIRRSGCTAPPNVREGCRHQGIEDAAVNMDAHFQAAEAGTGTSSIPGEAGDQVREQFSGGGSGGSEDEDGTPWSHGRLRPLHLDPLRDRVRPLTEPFRIFSFDFQDIRSLDNKCVCLQVSLLR